MDNLSCSTEAGYYATDLLEQSRSTWDWMVFSQNMVSSLVGFILAILAALIVSWVLRSFDRKSSIKGVIEELRNILEELSEITKNIDNQLLSPIGSNYWNSIISSSKIGLINHKKWFLEVSKIYSKVDEINEWLKLKTQCSFFIGVDFGSDKALLAQLSLAQVLQNKIIVENSDSNNSFRSRVDSVIKKMEGDLVFFKFKVKS